MSHADPGVPVFFFELDLQRNYYIRNVLLIGADSVVPLSERLEASGVESVWGEASKKVGTRYENVTLGKLAPGRLQTLWEWKNRVLLEECYIFNEVIPLEVQPTNATRHQRKQCNKYADKPK